MRYVKRSDGHGPEWTRLVQRAAAERERALRQFDETGEVTINEALYKEFMSFLLRMTANKCAYCEGEITGQPGDVEHFRPKRRVVDENFKPLHAIHSKKGPIPHPGYFWLAYEWENLLPSCTDCNRFRKHADEKGGKPTKAGKADRFPLKDETTRACEPDKVELESPLLIDPSKVDPQNHLELLPDGRIRPLSEEGEKTLEIFGLNLHGLIRLRRDAYDSTLDTIENYISKLRNNPERRRLAERINQMAAGASAYTSMRRLAVKEFQKQAAEGGVTITFPLPL